MFLLAENQEKQVFDNLTVLVICDNWRANSIEEKIFFGYTASSIEISP